MTPDPSAPAVALPNAAAESVDRSRPNYRLLSLLALGHLVIDTNQGSLPALLPYLKTALGLTYTATGVIVLMSTITSSLIQQLFGFLADKTARRWLLPLSVVLCAFGIALTGVAPSYAAVLALVMLSGFGVAAYHPRAIARPPRWRETGRPPGCRSSRRAAISASRWDRRSSRPSSRCSAWRAAWA